MATPVNLLQLSPTMTEGTIVKWLVKEGDKVQSAQPIAEVETDKAVMEQESFEDGTVLKIIAKEGDKVAVESLIAVIGEEGEDISALLGGAAAPKEAPAPKKEEPKLDQPITVEPEDEAREMVKGATPAEKKKTGSGEAGRVLASPLARKMAQDAGLDVADIEGSGPQGRVIKVDVEAAIEKGVPAKPAAAVAAQPTLAKPAAEQVAEEIQLSGMRQTIARRLVESKQTVPHFQLTAHVRSERLLEAVARIRETHPDSKVTVTHFIIKAMANVQMRHHAIRSQWAGEKLVVINGAHISVAVAIDEGLLTPVVRNAHTKGLLQLAQEIRELAKLARDRKLKPEEMTGGTQTISNLGMYGITEFNAIINPPESTIIAVGAVEDRPAVENGEVVPAKLMTLIMSCDHRVVDGAVGAQFLTDLKQALEDPMLMLL